jgi:hypothetical protein
VPTKLVTPAGEHRARTRDLSESGLFLDCAVPLSEGSRLNAMLILPEEFTGTERHWVVCELEVARVQRSGNHFGAAAKIVRLQVLPEAEYPDMERRIGERRSHDRRTSERMGSERRATDRRGERVIELNLPMADPEDGTWD